jgi:N-acetylglucosaminyl-diphospho-decaprenol L-rhamnosyltransferase
MTVDLAVIVVTHNSERYLGTCLSSLVAQLDEARMRVIVSDAGSQDRTAAIAARFPVRFLPGANDGFARSNNRALHELELNRARYVLFLNPDTELVSGSLDSLLAECDALPESGVFTVRQVDERGELVPTLYRFPTARRYWAEAMPLAWFRRRGRRILEPNRYRQAGHVDWAMGSFLLVRGSAMRDLRGFDERFFLFSEDVDLCRRAGSAGWLVTYLPSVTVMHTIAGRAPDPVRESRIAHAKLVYEAKWSSAPVRVLVRGSLLVRHGREALALQRSVGERRAAWAALAAALSRVPPGRIRIE